MSKKPISPQNPQNNRTKVPPPENLLKHQETPRLKDQGEADRKEHYDLDGVSFDESVGVVVASDANKLIESERKS